MTEGRGNQMAGPELPSVFDQIAESLRSGIAHARGELVLQTTNVSKWAK